MFRHVYQSFFWNRGDLGGEKKSIWDCYLPFVIGLVHNNNRTAASINIPKMVSLKLSGLVAIAGIASVNALNFDGKGQLRFFDWKDDSKDLGCVTNEGLWTFNEADCGTFTGVRNSDSDILMSSAIGNCYLDNIVWACSAGGKQLHWRVSVYVQSIWQISATQCTNLHHHSLQCSTHTLSKPLAMVNTVLWQPRLEPTLHRRLTLPSKWVSLATRSQEIMATFTGRRCKDMDKLNITSIPRRLEQWEQRYNSSSQIPTF